MSNTYDSDEGPDRARPGMAEAEAALDSEHERHLREARERTYAVADRLAGAAGYPGMLRPGKIVRLKSGGPPMTIAVVDIVDGLVYCHYFWRGTTGQARYSAEMLEPCEASGAESLVPPTKPGCGDEWTEPLQARTRAPRAKSRENPGAGDKSARARGKKTPKSKVNRRRIFRAQSEATPEQTEIQKRRESDKAWREHMRRLARMKRIAREREKLLREDQANEPNKHRLDPLPATESRPQEAPSEGAPERNERSPHPALESGEET